MAVGAEDAAERVQPEDARIEFPSSDDTAWQL